MVAIRHYAAIRDAAAQVARSANGTVDALVERRIEQEPAFTDRMLGSNRVRDGRLHFKGNSLECQDADGSRKKFAGERVSVRISLVC